jgi:beta-aspartyl-peptidase (threonine type)
MRHRGETLEEAARHVVMVDLGEHDGSGGVIAVDAAGNLALPYNCEGMYRGWVREGEAPVTAIHEA